ncbi:hypothetical protein ATANTOWER_017263 [Ataeniobius toweri]|uniref:Uncharacterized protein n=1 Tax=Ataeniobius toweri TaxID=208326 RepID=A0ABU7CK83_9TELE|nr:hypothetical protein [Ataeniobius toweri]
MEDNEELSTERFEKSIATQEEAINMLHLSEFIQKTSSKLTAGSQVGLMIGLDISDYHLTHMHHCYAWS